jgi:hypothetical protein
MPTVKQPSADPAVTHEPISLDAAGAKAEVPMVTLFTLHGQEYKIPARPRANLALKALQMTREYGPGLANVALLEELLGEEAFEALSSYEGLTDDQLQAVSKAARELTLGALEDEQGN